MNETIDAAKFHHLNGADTEEDAVWHIAMFVQWCGTRGLLAARHSPSEIDRDPVGYVLTACGGKLWRSDLSPAGSSFADAVYDDYLDYLGDMAVELDTDPFHLRTRDDAHDLRARPGEFLDEEYEEYADEQ